jgi:hypothetical protein
MDNFFEDLKKNRVENSVNFWGVVEDNADPMTLGRVKVRCYHYHSDNTEDIPTDALPWAVVLQPTTSSAISGIGDFAPLQIGTRVYGFFMDGRDAQYPVVTHTVPTVHRPEPAGVPSGTSTGFRDQGDYFSGDPTTPHDDWKYANQGISSDGTVDYSADYPNSVGQSDGALTAVGDINYVLQPKDSSRWNSLGLPTYTWHAAPAGYACKDGKESLKFHYGTALAFEKLTKMWGKGKFSITSAYRTPAYNARISGAAKHSLHMAGRAIDVDLGNIGSSQSALAAFGKMAVKCGFVGFGIYYSSNFIHIDTGTGRTWNGAAAQWFVNAIKEAGWYHGKKGLSGISVNQGSGSNTSTSSTPGAGDGSAPNGPVTASNSEQYIADRMKKAGYNDAAVSGALGNFKAESGVNPASYNPNDAGSEAYGFAQWRGSRLTALRNYTGEKFPGIQGQTDFFLHELDTSKSAAGSMLRNATDPVQAAVGFGDTFEVYQGHGDLNHPSTKTRIKNAQGYFGGGFPASDVKGFQDPTNSLPTPEYRGEPSTNMSARGFNTLSNQRRILTRDNGRMGGFPAAGDIGTFGEPELKAAPQYPYNMVRASRAGHLLEMDDTPDAERVNLEHSSGTGIEMFSDGAKSDRTQGNSYEMVEGDKYNGIGGKYFLTSVNDMHVRSTADMTTQADGAMHILIGNDGDMVVSGDYLISVGNDFKIKAKGKIIFECPEGLDILSHKDINIEAKGKMNLKSSGDMNVHSTDGGMSVKSKSTMNAQSTDGDMNVKSKTGTSVHATDGNVDVKAQGGSLNMQGDNGTNMKTSVIDTTNLIKARALDYVVPGGADGGVRDADNAGDSGDASGADSADIGDPPDRKVIEKDNMKNSSNKKGSITTEEAAHHYGSGYNVG